MNLRSMRPTDRDGAAALWLLTFGDSEAFTDWYFRERFDPVHSFAAFDGEALIAMTLGRGTKIVAEGKTHDALLISGVATRPEFRGRGLMHRLVRMQTEHAKNAGFACCYLHPVSESLYAALGFETGTDALLIASDADRTHEPLTLREGWDLSAMRTVYDALLYTHDGMQLRDEAEWNALKSDYAADGFCSMIAEGEDHLAGYLCCLYDGTVAELFAHTAPVYAALLDAAAARLNRPLQAIVPTDCGIAGERVYSMQYRIFDDAFRLPLKNGFCRLSY